jgi:membrane protein
VHAAAVIRRTAKGFYEDQMTHHAAALTYYALMSLFPVALLSLSLLVLVGQYPDTYLAIVGHLRDVVPPAALDPLDRSFRAALQHKGTATTALVFSVVTTLYGTTGVLEAARRALNVVFEVEGGRRFLHRKAIDVVSTIVLLVLVLAGLVMMFVGGRLADELFTSVGLGSAAAHVWSIVRWPGAVAVAMLVFALVYYVTPDVEQRAFRWVTPGAVLGVTLWLLASYGFSVYLSNFANLTALYGAFTAPIVLMVWLWITSCALLVGAELNAEIERQREVRDGVPMHDTLTLAERRS